MSRSIALWLCCASVVYVLLVLLSPTMSVEFSSLSKNTHYWRDDIEPAVTLVMTWLPGVCTAVVDQVDPQTRCRIEALRPFWTIKELRGTRRDCDAYGNVFVPNELRSELYQLWPSVHTPISFYVEFWTGHYKRDGTCFRDNPLLGSPVKFFMTALYLAKRLDLFVGLINAKYVPAVHPYEARRLEETFQKLHGARVRLRCPRRKDFLEEVEFCMDHLLNPRDCKRAFFHVECGSKLYYVTPPPPGMDPSPIYSVNPPTPEARGSCPVRQGDQDEPRDTGTSASHVTKDLYEEFFGTSDDDDSRLFGSL